MPGRPGSGTDGSDRGGRTGAGADGAAVLCLVDDPDLRATLVAACREVAVAVQVLGAGSAPAGQGRAGPADPDAARLSSSVGPGALSAAWSSAPLVLLDAAATAGAEHLPRRAGVVLVHRDRAGGEPDSATWRRAVAVGAEHVVVLPEGAGWLREAVLRAVRPRGCCVAVVGARGGAGATSAAVVLATAAATAGRRVVLVDLDPLGGGVDLAMGAEDLPGLRWPDLHDVREPLPPGGLSAALPVADGVSVLAWGRGAAPGPAAVRAVVRAALDEHDLVVVDLPRLGPPAAAAAAALADVVLCVCPSEVRAVASAPLVLRAAAGAARRHLLVRGPAPGGLRARDAGDGVRAGLDLLAEGALPVPLSRVDVVRAEPGLSAALERGEAFGVAARSPLGRWARRWVADELGEGRARAA